MATYFGEVILPSSRAFWDDKDDSDVENEDEESEGDIRSLLVESLKVDVALKGKQHELLIVIDGPVARGFAQNYLLTKSMKILATYDKPPKEEDPIDIMSIGKCKKEPSELYQLNDRTLLLVVSPLVDVAFANNLTTLVTPWIEKTKSILILASRPVTEFKCDSPSRLPNSFIKAISSSTAPFPTNIQRLEQPNFLSGPAASLLTWCEAKKYSCLLYVCYTESVFFDSVSMSPFIHLFKSPPYNHLLANINPDLSKSLNSGQLSNMYL